MHRGSVLTINTDGGARGNPGPAAYAYVMVREGGPPIEEAGCLGNLTNNQAEYTALIRALEHAARLGTHHHLVIRSDSELLVKQMNGQYRVKDEGLRPLYEQARRLCEPFASVTIRHVPRAENSWADRLYNEALDGAASRPKTTPPRLGKREAARQEAVARLRAAALAWSAGDPEAPSPEQVWDQLWCILEEQGLVRRAHGH